jgi:hypothetical protein
MLVHIFAFLLAVPATSVSATQICLAPASAQMAGSSSADASAALTEMVKSYLTGPTLSVAPLSARLASQAREEAKRADCRFVLFVSIKQERKSETKGVLGRVASRAAQEAAWSAGVNASSAAGRVAAGAVAGAANAAAANIATTTKVRDEMELTYRLESATGAVIAENKANRKAKSDGEDLLTPLVEHAAEEIAAAVSK